MCRNSHIASQISEEAGDEECQQTAQCRQPQESEQRGRGCWALGQLQKERSPSPEDQTRRERKATHQDFDFLNQLYPIEIYHELQMQAHMSF